MNLASERSFNYLFNSNLNAKELMYLDVLSDFITSKWFKCYMNISIPKSIYNEKIKNFALLNKPLNLMNGGGVEINFSDTDLKFRYSFLRDKKSVEFFNAFMKISKIKVDKYSFRTINETHSYNDLIPTDDLLKMDIIYNRASNRNILERHYKLNFSTNFGCHYVYNLALLNHDWFPEGIYQSNNFTQNFYRTFLLSKFKQKELLESDVKDKLNLKGDSYYMKTNITKSLNFLKDKGYIKDWKSEHIFRNRVWTIIKSKKYIRKKF